MKTATSPLLCSALALLLSLAPLASIALADAGDDDSATAATQAGDDHAPAVPQPTPGPTPEAGKQTTEICDDKQDNDGDGLVDCKDLNDCAAFATCGQISGGWGWVISAYGISFVALFGYALMVTLRLRSQQGRRDE